MRDARAQGRQERRAGPDRGLARRTGPLNESILRIAAAIVVDALAFGIWDLSARGPRQLLRDVAQGARRPAGLALGVARFLVGALLLFGSLRVLEPLELPVYAFRIVAITAALTGLLVEFLIDSDPAIRAGRGLGRPEGGG